MATYSNIDRKIDTYLGTSNLRPGPMKRLHNVTTQVDKNKEDKISDINYNALSLQIKKNINWDTLVSVKNSLALPPDMLVLEFIGNKLLYIQSTSSAPEYLFTYLLYKSFNINISEARLIEYKDPEYLKMMDNIQSKTCDTTLKRIIQNNFRENPFIIIYEYMPIVTIQELSQTKASKFLQNNTSERSREIMINIGKIIALDMISNSEPKVPFVYNHPGFPMLIGLLVNHKIIRPNYDFKNKHSLEIYFEDSPISIINSKATTYTTKDKVELKNMSDYRNSIEKNIKLLFYELRTIMNYGNEINNFLFRSMFNSLKYFNNVCNYDLSSVNCFHIGIGILAIIDDFSQLEINNIEDLIKYIKEDAIFKDFGDVYERSSFKLNIEYFKYIKKTICDVKDENDDIFIWMREFTFKVYNLNKIKTKTINEKQVDGENKNNNEKLKNNLLFSKEKKGKIENKSEVSTKPVIEEVKVKETNQLIKPNQVEVRKPTSNNETALIFYHNVVKVIERNNQLKYNPIKEIEKGSQVEIILNKKALEQKGYDDFNENRHDTYKYINDVHNGIYEVFDIDDPIGREFIMEWKNLDLHPGVDTKVPVTEIKNQELPPVFNRLESKKRVEYDHKTYTREEYKELVNKKELKGTLNIKEELNKEEAELLKSKIKDVDSELLEGSEYQGEKLGKKYQINKKMDDDLTKTLNKIEEDKKTKEELSKIQEEKRLNEIKRKEKEETNNLNFN